MSAKNVVLLIVALGALGAAAAIFMSRTGGPDPEGLGQSMPMLCMACNAEFDVGKGDASGQLAGGAPVCPECGDRRTSRAFVCPACGRYLDFVGHGGAPESCKYCRVKIDDSGFAEDQAQRHKAIDDAIQREAQKNGG